MSCRTLSNFSNYFIYSDGQVFSQKKNQYLPFQKTRDGYLVVTLQSDEGDRKTFKVHRLVALCFIENPDNKETVNHKDGNKENNQVSNLEWSTRSEQSQHAWDNGLIKDLESRKLGIRKHQGKPVICVTTGEIFSSIGEAAEVKNLKKSNISSVCLGKKGYKSAGISENGDKLIWRFYE